MEQVRSEEGESCKIDEFDKGEDGGATEKPGLRGSPKGNEPIFGSEVLAAGFGILVVIALSMMMFCVIFCFCKKKRVESVAIGAL